MLQRLRMIARQAMAWILQDNHKAKAKQLQAEVKKAFTEHPEDAGETYLQHLWFTFRLSLRFAYVTMVILIHGLFPFLFATTSSRQIEKVYAIMKTRIPKSRLAEIEQDDDGRDAA